MGREEQIIQERLRKLKELKAEGINPYPHKYEVKHYSEDLQEKYKKLKEEAQTKDKVKVAGRLMTIRDLGKIAFASLQDSKGKIQITLQEKSTPEEIRTFFKKYIDTGDFIGVEGIIFRTKRGELSILVKSLTLLTKSLAPLPDKWHGLQDKEERYRKRYLDLIMQPELKNVFEARTKTVNAIREYLTKKDYIEVDTPILQPIYGGTSAKPFETELNALKMKVYMRISNELYLKRLIAGGYEKIFEFSKDFRNEGIDATHNPEFLQVETMCAYADYKQNMDLVEEMVEHVVKKVCGK
ncbi:MAG: amino acid--tRNA ligase-related protein, partial [archaeon]